MANRAKGFTVVAGKRASGSLYWLARGSKDRRQIRREFDNHPDALAFAEQQNSSAALGEPVKIHATTHLPLAQLRDAETVAAQLQREFPGVGLLELFDYYRSLSPIVSAGEASKAAAALTRIHDKFPDADLSVVGDWFVSNYRVPSTRIPLSNALEHYLKDAERRHETKTLSRPQFNRIGYAMAEIEEYFGSDAPLATLTTGRLSEFLKATTKGRDGAAYSNKTWNNRRGYIGAFLEYCREERWIESNPVSAIRAYKKKDLPPSVPIILTVERAEKVMAYAEKLENGRLVPFFAICLFAGIRPDYNDGEISKLCVDHFDLTTAELKISSEVSKVRRARVVILQPNLIRWLKVYPLDKFPIICTNFRKLYLKARQELQLEHDVLRHTYCSMLVGKFRSVADAALQAGNSEGVIWESYMSLVPQKTAKLFWKIVPARR